MQQRSLFQLTTPDHPWPLGLLAACVALLAGLAAGWYAWTAGVAVGVDVGVATDRALVQNFYERERLDNASYRWGRDNPQVQLPLMRGPALLTLRMAGRPGGLQVAIQSAGQTDSAFEVRGAELRRYRTLWYGDGTGDATTITIAAQSERVPPEKRALSVLIDTVRMEPLAVSSAPLPWRLVLVFGLAALGAYALLRGIGLPRIGALAVGALAVGALAVGWSNQRALVAPYTTPLVVAVGVLATLLALARWRVGRRLGDDEFVLCLVLAGGLAWAYVAWETVSLNDPIHLALVLAPLVLAGGGLLAGRRARAVLVLAALLAHVLLVVQQFGAVYGDALNLRSDFHALLRGAARVHFGTLPLYNQTVIKANPFANTFTAPPLVALLLQPLAGMALEQALAAWRALSLALLLPVAALLMRAYRLPLRSWPVAALVMLLTMWPVVSTIADGQLSLLLLALVALAVWGMQRGHALVWGAVLGVIAAINPAFVVLFVFVVVRREWRALLAACGALLIAMLVSTAVFGVATQLVYLLGVLPNLTRNTSWVENQSLSALISRFYEVDRLAPQPAIGGSVGRMGMIASLVVLLTTAWLARAGGGMRLDHAFGLTLTAALLALPVSWIHYEVLLAIPFVQACVAARDAELGLAWPAAACYMLAWLLIGYGDRWLFFDDKLYGAFWQLVLSYKCYGTLLLYAAIVTAMRPQSNAQPAARPAPATHFSAPPA